MIHETSPPLAGVGVGSGWVSTTGRSGGMGRGITTTRSGVATGGRVFHWNDAIPSGVGTGG